MIKFIKNDFIRGREALNEVVGRRIPLGSYILYYVIGFILSLPLRLCAIIWYRYKIRKIEKILKREA